ncbi:hypothetical protein D3C86_1575930 [compost metagenome]
MNSTIWYRRVRGRRLVVLRHCSVSSSRISASSLVSGTATLAMNTISAMSQEPICQSSTTPPRMVWALSPSTELTCITGSTLAGM